MGLNMLLSCKKSCLIETVVSITVIISVLALQIYLKINSELFILFLSKSFKQTERGFSSFKLDQGCLRITYDTLTVSSSYCYDIITRGGWVAVLTI